MWCWKAGKRLHAPPCRRMSSPTATPKLLVHNTTHSPRTACNTACTAPRQSDLHACTSRSQTEEPTHPQCCCTAPMQHQNMNAKPSVCSVSPLCCTPSLSSTTTCLLTVPTHHHLTVPHTRQGRPHGAPACRTRYPQTRHRPPSRPALTGPGHNPVGGRQLQLRSRCAGTTHTTSTHHPLSQPLRLPLRPLLLQGKHVHRRRGLGLLQPPSPDEKQAPKSPAFAS